MMIKKYNQRISLKKIIIVLIVLMLLILFSFILFNNNNVEKTIGSNNQLANDETKKVVLKEYVKTNKKINFYKKEVTEYKKIGEINEGVIIHITGDSDDYYKVEDLDEEYYVRSDNLVNYDEEIKINDRYKKYILFNKNIKTDNVTSFYDEENKLVYILNKSMNLPIIIMEDDRVGVIFNNRILYIKLDNNSSLIDNNNTNDKNVNGIGVLNYHFFYDDSKEDESKCDQDICLSLTKLKEQLDYIKKNNYFTPTMKEFEMYIDGKIQLPKSVVITIDDGWRALEGTKVITEYKLNATVFVITSTYNPNDFRNEYIEVHSHSDNMHNKGDCSTGQGGGIQCLSEDKILNDLKTSSDKLNGSTVFCYPFYEYNDYSISMLKKAGYTMAFAGENKNSYNMTKVGSNKYKIPRFVIINYTTMDDFSRYLSGKFFS